MAVGMSAAAGSAMSAAVVANKVSFVVMKVFSQRSPRGQHGRRALRTGNVEASAVISLAGIAFAARPTRECYPARVGGGTVYVRGVLSARMMIAQFAAIWRKTTRAVRLTSR
jgi:hypothetical protein